MDPQKEKQQEELAFWNAITRLPDPVVGYQAYLRKVKSGDFPGTYRELAEAYVKPHATAHASSSAASSHSSSSTTGGKLSSPITATVVRALHGQSDKQMETDIRECAAWSLGLTGFQPFKPAGPDNRLAPADYHRTMLACLSARDHDVQSAEAGDLPGSPSRAGMTLYPYYGQNDQMLETDLRQCHLWAVRVTGLDPTRCASSDRYGDYRRALQVCLKVRGYAAS
jgi:hypothetical protein